MIEVSYHVFLWVYLALASLTLLFIAASLYHLIRFSFETTVSVFMTFVLIAGTAVIVFVTYDQLRWVNWGETFDVWEFMLSLNPF